MYKSQGGCFETQSIKVQRSILVIKIIKKTKKILKMLIVVVLLLWGKRQWQLSCHLQCSDVKDIQHKNTPKSEEHQFSKTDRHTLV